VSHDREADEMVQRTISSGERPELEARGRGALEEGPAFLSSLSVLQEKLSPSLGSSTCFDKKCSDEAIVNNKRTTCACNTKPLLSSCAS
jgi:hypothetical protein